MAPHADARPFAIRRDEPDEELRHGRHVGRGRNPAVGHLGAILYGARRSTPSGWKNGASLFATFRAVDPGWAIVEYNTADLRDMKVQPHYEAGYRGFRDMWNYGARFVSPMAWNGSNGATPESPATSRSPRGATRRSRKRRAISCWRTPACRSTSRLWTFGTPACRRRRLDRGARHAHARQRLSCAAAPDGGWPRRFAAPSCRRRRTRGDRAILGLADPGAGIRASARRVGAARSGWEIAVVPNAA